MELLPGETILLESDPEGLTLTTHRVRSEARGWAGKEVVSIMLDEIASCSITHSSSPILLIFAAIALLGGFIAPMNSRSNTETLALGIIIAMILVIAFYVTRQQILTIASAGNTINRSIKGMSMQTATHFIDTIERAKNERYLHGTRTQHSL